MGRKFAPFDVVIHFTGLKSKAEIQGIINDFYLNGIKTVLAESMLFEDQRCKMLDQIAAYYKSHENSQEV